MEIYTSGLSKKFFKEYLERMQHIDEESIRKCKETIEALNIPTTDEYGKQTKEVPFRAKKSIGGQA